MSVKRLFKHRKILLESGASHETADKMAAAEMILADALRTARENGDEKQLRALVKTALHCLLFPEEDAKDKKTHRLLVNIALETIEEHKEAWLRMIEERLKDGTY